MEWIKIQKKSPKHLQIVIVIDILSSIVTLARFREMDETMDDDCFDVMNLDEIEIDFCVTHWMPLPLPPDNESHLPMAASQ